MLNTKEVETTLAVEELDNEVAAAIQGGYDMEIYQHANGIQLLGHFNQSKSFLASRENDKISSIRVNAGKWRFYEHADYSGRVWDVITPGLRNVPSWLNDKISSWMRIS